MPNDYTMAEGEVIGLSTLTNLGFIYSNFRAIFLIKVPISCLRAYEANIYVCLYGGQRGPNIAKILFT